MTIRDVPENVMLWLVAQGYTVTSVKQDSENLYTLTREE